MARYALFQANTIRTGVVNDIIDAPRAMDGTTYQLAEMYTAEFITWLRPIPDPDDIDMIVEVGDSFDGTSWSKKP